MDGDLDAYLDSLKKKPKSDPLDGYLDSIAPNSSVKDLLAQMRGGTSRQESGGRTRIINPDSGATGEFQVMRENIPRWTKTYLDRELTPEQFRNDPTAQRKVFDGEMGKYLTIALKKANGDPEIAKRMAAAAWYGGLGNMHLYDTTHPQIDKKTGRKYPSFREYTTRVVGRSKSAPFRDAPQYEDSGTEEPLEFTPVPKQELKPFDVDAFLYGSQEEVNNLLLEGFDINDPANVTGLLPPVGEATPDQVQQDRSQIPQQQQDPLAQHPGAYVEAQHESPAEPQPFVQPKDAEFDVNANYRENLKITGEEDTPEARKAYLAGLNEEARQSQKTPYEGETRRPGAKTPQKSPQPQAEASLTGIQADKPRPSGAVVDVEELTPTEGAKGDVLKGAAIKTAIDFTRAPKENISRWAYEQSLNALIGRYGITRQDIDKYLPSPSGQKGTIEWTGWQDYEGRLGELQTKLKGFKGDKYEGQPVGYVTITNDTVNDILNFKSGGKGVNPKLQTEVEYRSTLTPEGLKRSQHNEGVRRQEDAAKKAVRAQITADVASASDPSTFQFYVQEMLKNPISRMADLYDLWTKGAEGIKERKANNDAQEIDTQFAKILEKQTAVEYLKKQDQLADMPPLAKVSQTLGQFVQGMITDNVAPILEAGGIFQAAFDRYARAVPLVQTGHIRIAPTGAGKNTEASKTDLFKSAEALREAGERMFGESDKGTLNQLFRTLGQVSGMMLATVRIGGGIGRFKGTVADATEISSLLTTASGGTVKVAPNSWLVPSVQGILQQSSEAYKMAKDANATEDQALLAATLSAPGGFVEGLSEKVLITKLNRIQTLDKVTGGGFSKMILSKIKQLGTLGSIAAEGGLTEWVEEGVQGVTNSTAGKIAYEKEGVTLGGFFRDFDKALIDNWIALPVGAIMGGGVGAINLYESQQAVNTERELFEAKQQEGYRQQLEEQFKSEKPDETKPDTQEGKPEIPKGQVQAPSMKWSEESIKQLTKTEIETAKKHQEITLPEVDVDGTMTQTTMGAGQAVRKLRKQYSLLEKLEACVNAAG